MKNAFVTVTAAAAALLLTACQDQGTQQEPMTETETEQQAAGEQQYGEEQYGEPQREESAFGETGEQQQAQAGQQQQPEQEQELLHRSQPQQAQGDVTELNEKEGTLTLQTQAGEELEIHGTPSQLQDYQQGQQANLEYVSFEGTNWIANPTAGTGQGEQVQGRVSDIKAADGEITLEGAEPSTFRAHPENLQDVQPGQQVSITYESKEDTNWANQIQAESAEGAQQPSEQQPSEQQPAQEQPEQQGGY